MTDTQVMAALEPTHVDIEKLRKLLAKATLGPWEVDSEYDGDGHASGGGGCTTGWHNYFVGAEVDGKWRTLLDTVNSDHKLIEDDRDEEGGRSWDAIGEANANLVAAAINALPHLLDELARHRVASSPAAEPVAWMYEKNGGRILHFTRTPEFVTKMGHTENPLYTAPPPAGDVLFEAIAHGDEKHRAWLKQAIADHFAGRPVQREPSTPVAGDAELRKALQWIKTRLTPHPDDTLEDDRRNKRIAYAIVKNALATPPSVPAQQGWQPIETAPKDGSDVQLWGGEEWTPQAHYCATKDGWFQSYWDADWGSYAESLVYQPTHWQPLPTPPAQDQKGAETK